MATVFFVKDGPRTLGSRTNEGINKSVEEITSLTTGYSSVFLDGLPEGETPEFHGSHPSDDYRRVVVEVTQEDQLNHKFSRVGFYVVDAMDVSKAIVLFK
jgi:hypothetical protein